MRDDAAEIRNNNTLDMREKTTKMNNAARLMASKISAAGTAEEYEPLAEMYKDGSQAFEQLPTGKAKNIILNKLAKDGFRVIPKKTQEKLEGLGVVSQIYGLYNQLNNAYKNGDLSSIRDLEERSDALLGIVARVYSGEKGALSNPDIARVKGARPGRINALISPGKNDERMKDFATFYQGIVKNAKGTMSPEQDKMITDRFNLRLTNTKMMKHPRTGQMVEGVSTDGGLTYDLPDQ